MSAQEHYRWIRESEETLAEKVIFATGDTLNPKTWEFPGNSRDTWLGNPATVEELENAVRK